MVRQSGPVHFIGVDLAWGDSGPPGLAVLDEGGRWSTCRRRTDEDIEVRGARRLRRARASSRFDAPLVVTNDTGNRPAEAALNRDFARFDAGAHPSNRGKAEFAGLPRGAGSPTGSTSHIDPASTAPRRAVEVYPHAATVALFRLGRTLKYKNKKGRPLDPLRCELLPLIGPARGPGRRLAGDAPHRPPRVERPGGAHRGRRAQERAAPRRGPGRRRRLRLRRALRRAPPGDLTARTATPHRCDRDADACRPATSPTPSSPPTSTRRSAAPSRSTPQLQPELREATDAYVELVTSLLDDAGINYLSVTGRAKTVASFAAKAERTDGGQPLYRDPLHQITDQIGVRVITYVRSDVTAVADVLSDQLRVLDDRDMGEVTASEGRFGYASRHLLVELDDARAEGASDLLRRRSAQVQVRTVLQHAWAEFEHDIRYKGVVPEEHAPDLDRRFTLAAGLLELADSEFSAIRDRLRTGQATERDELDDTDPRIAANDLAAFLAAEFSDAEWSRTDHYEWISGLLLELGITSLDELAGLLSTIDVAAIDARTAYRYPPGAVRRLDDALLAVFGSRYLALHGNAHREALLRARLDRLRGNDSSP